MTITCPYCWQNFDVQVDVSGGATQQFTVDCEVCCRPILCSVTLDADGLPEIRTDVENSG